MTTEIDADSHARLLIVPFADIFDSTHCSLVYPLFTVCLEKKTKIEFIGSFGKIYRDGRKRNNRPAKKADEKQNKWHKNRKN